MEVVLETKTESTGNKNMIFFDCYCGFISLLEGFKISSHGYKFRLVENLKNKVEDWRKKRKNFEIPSCL